MVKLIYKPTFNKELSTRTTLKSIEDVNKLIKVCSSYSRAYILKDKQRLDITIDGHIVTNLYGKQNDILLWTNGNTTISSLDIKELDES